MKSVIVPIDRGVWELSEVEIGSGRPPAAAVVAVRPGPGRDEYGRRRFHVIFGDRAEGRDFSAPFGWAKIAKDEFGIGEVEGLRSAVQMGLQDEFRGR